MYSKVPAELQALPQWVCWRYEEIEGRSKPSKVPLNPRTGDRAKSNDRGTWGTFAEAVEGIERHWANGIGIMFADGVMGIDIDGCINASGVMQPEAMDIINTVRSYTETSPSQTGIHILCMGTLPEGARRKGNIEMYCDGRFFTVTGQPYEISYDFGDRTAEVAQVHKKYLAREEPAPAPPRPAQTSTIHTPQTIDEILERAFASKDGHKIRELYDGRWENLGLGDGSQSSADQAFCNHLAFWFGCDRDTMDAVFRRSALYRPKWDKRRGALTYGQKTIEKAIEGCTSVYDPQPRASSPPMRAAAPPAPRKAGAAPSAPTKPPSPPKKPPETLPEDEAGEGNPQKYYEWDDTGNANRFRDTYIKDLRYNPVDKVWVCWDGKRWAPDEIGRAKRMADKMLDGMKKQRFGDDAIEKAFQKHLGRSRSHRGKSAFIEETKHLPGIPILPADLDRQPSAFNTLTHVVNLRKGTVAGHERKLYLSKLAGTEYDATADCPRWRSFLTDITGGDGELLLYLQRMVGYCLTASTAEQCVFFLWGDGSNGKSTFVDIIAEMMGEYATSCQPETVMMRDKNNSARADIARLRGCRMVSTYEPNEGSRLDEGIVKQLTGGDKVVARFLYGREFEFKPEFKILMATNYKPAIKGTDAGIWRRVRLIPFTVTIPDDKKDKQLPAKLRRELPGILNWAIEGSIGWHREGMPKCAAVEGAVAEYRNEMDKFQQFADDCLEPSPSGAIQASTLYQCYRAWASDQGDRYPVGANKFASEMRKRYEMRKTSAYNEYLRVVFSARGGKILHPNPSPDYD